MRGLCLPAVLILLGASPNLYISAGDRRDGPAAETRRVSLNLTNTGIVPAREAQIDAITGIEVLTELPVSVTLVTSLPISLGTIDSNATASTPLLFHWPSTASHIRIMVQCSAGHGAYRTSTTLTLSR
jgi:hypothetical protein